MLINHPRFPVCYGLERSIFSELNTIHASFQFTDYLAIQWHPWCRAHRAGLAHFEYKASNTPYAISVCSEILVLRIPEKVAFTGVTHLFCSFPFSKDNVNEFKRYNIELIFLPLQKKSVSLNVDSDKVLSIRAKGKEEKTLEFSLYRQKNIERIETNSGRIVFSDSVPEKVIDIATHDIEHSYEVASLFESACFVVCRTSCITQIKLVCLAIKCGTVPVIPSDNFSRFEYLPFVLQELIRFPFSRVYFPHVTGSNVCEIKSLYLDNLAQFSYYFGEENSELLAILDVVYHLTNYSVLNTHQNNSLINA